MVAHESDHQYTLQVFHAGKWIDVRKVTKRNAAKVARSATIKLGEVHRVINLSKNNAVFIETRPV